MFVTFDKAAVYEAADYRSQILATLRRGDSVSAIAADRMYMQVRAGATVGFVLRANLSDRPAAVKPSARKKSSPVGRPDTPRTASAGRVRKKPAPVTEAKSSQSTSSSAPASQTSMTGAVDSSGNPVDEALGRSGTKTSTVRSKRKLPGIQHPQCAALTRSGKQCSRRAGDSSVYCWQHKK